MLASEYLNNVYTRIQLQGALGNPDHFKCGLNDAHNAKVHSYILIPLEE